MEGDSIAVSFDGPSQVVSNGQAVKNITTPAREGAPTTANPAPAETAENTEPAQATAEQALQTTTRSPERQAKLDAAAAAAREESAASTEPAPRQPQATAEMQDGERVNGEGAAKVDQAELPSEVTGPKDENTVSSKKGAIDQGMGNQETGDDFGVVADPASIDFRDNTASAAAGRQSETPPESAAPPAASQPETSSAKDEVDQGPDGNDESVVVDDVPADKVEPAPSIAASTASDVIDQGPDGNDESVVADESSSGNSGSDTTKSITPEIAALDAKVEADRRALYDNGNAILEASANGNDDEAARLGSEAGQLGENLAASMKAADDARAAMTAVDAPATKSSAPDAIPEVTPMMAEPQLPEGSTLAESAGITQSRSPEDALGAIPDAIPEVTPMMAEPKIDVPNLTDPLTPERAQEIAGGTTFGADLTTKNTGEPQLPEGSTLAESAGITPPRDPEEALNTIPEGVTPQNPALAGGDAPPSPAVAGSDAPPSPAVAGSDAPGAQPVITAKKGSSGPEKDGKGDGAVPAPEEFKAVEPSAREVALAGMADKGTVIKQGYSNKNTGAEADDTRNVQEALEKAGYVKSEGVESYRASKDGVKYAKDENGKDTKAVMIAKEDFGYNQRPRNGKPGLTETAIDNFKKDHGITEKGAGPETMAALSVYSNENIPEDKKQQYAKDVAEQVRGKQGTPSEVLAAATQKAIDEKKAVVQAQPEASGQQKGTETRDTVTKSASSTAEPTIKTAIGDLTNDNVKQIENEIGLPVMGMNKEGELNPVAQRSVDAFAQKFSDLNGDPKYDGPYSKPYQEAMTEARRVAKSTVDGLDGLSQETKTNINNSIDVAQAKAPKEGELAEGVNSRAAAVAETKARMAIDKAKADAEQLATEQPAQQGGAITKGFKDSDSNQQLGPVKPQEKAPDITSPDYAKNLVESATGIKKPEAEPNAPRPPLMAAGAGAQKPAEASKPEVTSPQPQQLGPVKPQEKAPDITSPDYAKNLVESATGIKKPEAEPNAPRPSLKADANTPVEPEKVNQQPEKQQKGAPVTPNGEKPQENAALKGGDVKQMVAEAKENNKDKSPVLDANNLAAALKDFNAKATTNSGVAANSVGAPNQNRSVGNSVG